MSTPNTGTGPRDACPEWASDIFFRIHQLEIGLGNIREIPKNSGVEEEAKWQTFALAKLMARLGADDEDETNRTWKMDEQATEILFSSACKRLVASGFSVSEVVGFANSRIGFNGTLPYCNEGDVNEALSIDAPAK